jgi:hypothetical protein
MYTVGRIANVVILAQISSEFAFPPSLLVLKVALVTVRLVV